MANRISQYSYIRSQTEALSITDTELHSQTGYPSTPIKRVKQKPFSLLTLYTFANRISKYPYIRSQTEALSIIDTKLDSQTGYPSTPI